MSNVASMDLTLLKRRLMGSNLKNLLKKKKLSKWRVAKDCGLTYRTLLNWEQEKVDPSDEYILRVAKYFGLIKLKDAEIAELKKEQKQLATKIERLSNA